MSGSALGAARLLDLLTQSQSFGTLEKQPTGRTPKTDLVHRFADGGICMFVSGGNPDTVATGKIYVPDCRDRTHVSVRGNSQRLGHGHLRHHEAGRAEELSSL